MIFEAMTVGSFLSNCYIVGAETTKEAAIIDPGADFVRIENEIKELGLTPKIIILTHAHGDHIGAVKDFVEKYGTKVYIHKEDAEMLKDGNKNFSKILTGKSMSIIPDVELEDKDEIKLGDLNFEIIQSIKEKIFKYDDDTVIYPGHNSPSTIKSEKLGNPFVK